MFKDFIFQYSRIEGMGLCSLSPHPTFLPKYTCIYIKVYMCVHMLSQILDSLHLHFDFYLAILVLSHYVFKVCININIFLSVKQLEPANLEWKK